jgi:hypothetical protein
VKNMVTANKPYQRLPGTGYRYVVPLWAMFLMFFVIGIFVLLFRGRRVQLWQGEEHLLLVEWDGTREYYKRFGYGDIQAFIVRKTSEGMILNVVLLAVIILISFWGISISDTIGRAVLLSIAGIFALVLLANFLSGPTCKCWVQTAVQVEDLTSLSRLPRARKVLTRLRPLITHVQGELSPEEVSARLQQSVTGTAVGLTVGATPLESGVDESKASSPPAA